MDRISWTERVINEDVLERLVLERYTKPKRKHVWSNACLNYVKKMRKASNKLSEPDKAECHGHVA